MSRTSRNLLLAAPVLALASLGAQGVAAQSSGFYLNGHAQAGVISAGGDIYGTTDLDFGYDAASAGGGSWGVDANLQGYYSRTSTSSSTMGAISASLYFDTSYGRFSIGMPDSPLDDYVGYPDMAGSSLGTLLLLPVRISSNSFLRLTGMQVYGLRYDGSAGNFEYGAAASYVAGGGGDTLLEGAVSYQNGNYTLGAGVESYSGSGVIGYNISARMDTGRLSAEASVVRPAVFPIGTFYDVNMGYAVNDNLSATLGVFGRLVPSGGLTLPYAGVRYTIFENGYINASGLDVFSGSPVYEIAVGWNFDIGS